MASIDSSLHIPFLPLEIHFVLAEHIYRGDLPNYRLASKALAEAGRKQLFHTLKLRNTLSSVASFRCIVQNKQLSSYVRTLIWDATAWRVGPDARDWHEWTRHCEMRAETVDPDQAALYRELAASQQYWQAYVSRFKEEKSAKRALGTMTCFDSSFSWSSCLPNLHTIHVFLGGPYSPEEWRMCQPTDDHSSPFESCSAGWLPITRPLGAWRGDRSGSLDGPFARTISNALKNVPDCRIYGYNPRWHARILRHESSLRQTNLSVRYNTALLSSHPIEPPKVYYKHLIQYPSLESISLSLRSRDFEYEDPLSLGMATKPTVDSTFEGMGMSGLSQPFSRDAYVWRCLRKLSLAYFGTTPRALLFLLARHSSTLRDLRLQALRLDGIDISETVLRHAWGNIFRDIGSTTNLARVVLAGVFRNKHKKDDTWNFDKGDLAQALSSWMIQGGDFPFKDRCIDK